MDAERHYERGLALTALLSSWFSLFGASAGEPSPPPPKPQTIRVAGMLEADGEARYNTAVSINAQGELIGKYHKQQLDHESVRNTAGTNSSVSATPQGKIGVMICADRRIPDVVKGFCDQGADFLLCPSGGMFGPTRNDPILQARSRENHKYIVFVHPAEF